MDTVKPGRPAVTDQKKGAKREGGSPHRPAAPERRHEPPEHHRDANEQHEGREERCEEREYRLKTPEDHQRRDRDDHDRERQRRRKDDDDLRLSRIVERTWYFEETECEDDDRPRHRGDDDRRHDRDDHDDDHHHHHGSRGGRPSRPPGCDTGRLGDGGPLTKGDIDHPLPPGVWVGPRADMDLPYLFMRANPADLGKRPVVGAPFWESPDIFVLAGVTPSLAPPIPAKLGGVGLAGQPNTLYAHVWNFGKAASNEVVVEFYWCDPSLGINASTVQLIAQTTTSLGPRGSGRNHAVVKCPEAWTPTFVNGGHECLLVRVWDNPADLPGEPRFDASTNRHVAQRNIHVLGGTAKAMMGIIGGDAPAPVLDQPLLIRVGALYGEPAEVSVERVAPHTMPWLQLHTGQRGVFPSMAAPTGAPALSPPTTGGGGFPTTAGGPSHTVAGDDQLVAFSTSDQAPGPGEAHVYRVSAKQGGAVFGGYTVVVLG